MSNVRVQMAKQVRDAVMPEALAYRLDSGDRRWLIKPGAGNCPNCKLPLCANPVLPDRIGCAKCRIAPPDSN